MYAWANAQELSVGFYASTTVTTNVPYTSWWQGILITNGKSGISKQMIIQDQASSNPVYKNVMSAGSWTGWTKIATASPPTEYSLPYNDDIVDRNEGSTYYKDQFGIVHVDMCCQISGTSDDIMNTSTIATLPAGFHPRKTIMRNARAYRASEDVVYVAEMQVNTDGRIVLYLPVHTYVQNARCSFTFIAGN